MIIVTNLSGKVLTGPFASTAPEIWKHGLYHTEKLVSIQTAISGIEAKLAIQNGRIAKSEEKYNSLPCKTRDEVSKNNALWLKIHLVGLWSCICGIIYVVYEVIKNK